MDINQLNRAYAEQYFKDHNLKEQYKKAMNKEPVAWINEDGNYIIHNDWKNNPANPDAYYYTIPLYPAPRELSDDEIMNVFDGCLFDGGFNAIEFARAILKKASEK